MPIHKFHSQRARERGGKPLYYFKGSREELSGLPVEGIRETFRKSGFGISRKSALKFRQGAIDALEKKRPLFELGTLRGTVAFRAGRMPDGMVYLHQFPLTHGVRRSGMRSKGSFTDFEALKAILKKGFRARPRILTYRQNAVLKPERKTVASWADPDFSKGITAGDRYSVELMSKYSDSFVEYKRVSSTSPSQVLRVNIELKKGQPKEEIERKKAFYREQLKGTPITFIESPA